MTFSLFSSISTHYIKNIPNSTNINSLQPTLTYFNSLPKKKYQLQPTLTHLNQLQPTSPFYLPNLPTKTTGSKSHMILYKLLKLWRGGLKWVEVGWSGLKWVEIGWSGLKLVFFFQVGWSRLKWVEVSWSRLKWVKVDWPTKRTGP